MTTILLTANSTWGLANYRSGLIRAIMDRGMQVTVLAPDDGHVDRLKALGCRVVLLEMDNKGTSPLRDARLFLTFRRQLRALRPKAILSFTVKNNVYCGLAARNAKIPFLPNVSGLGTAFVTETWLTKVVTRLSAAAFWRLPAVIFQNPDDSALFVARGIVTPQSCIVVPGSGVNLTQFAPTPLTRNEVTTFVLIARLLWDKGVGEFVEAARLLRAAGVPVRCQLLGFVDVKNRTAISRDTVDAWQAEGIIDYLGATDDVRPTIAAADCVVLPSYYREGTPRSLLESAAMARPVITTDMPGCRTVVDDNVTGYLCIARDAESLANAMKRFAMMPYEAKVSMAAAARQKMERSFDERIVIDTYLRWIDELKRQPGLR